MSAGPMKASIPTSADRSDIMICGYNKSHCGYCDDKDEDGSISFGVLSRRMRVHDYQELMLKGWRRSGTYLYKPTNFATCCPSYTIRLHVTKFQPTKKQRQVMRKMERFCKTGEVNAEKTAIEGMGTGEGNTHVMTIRHVDAVCDDERFELYKKYQIEVHKDAPEAITKASFNRFLCASPLVKETRPIEDHESGSKRLPVKYGTHHQLYRLDGRLVAVGVVDVLPSGLSSVYAFYDPADKHLALGKYTALKEIEWTQRMGLQYYYLGYYIHDCDKMKYKADYGPSELLCSTSLEWFPYAACKHVLDRGDEPCVFTPFHPQHLQTRLSLGLSDSEKRRAASSAEKEGRAPPREKGAALGEDGDAKRMSGEVGDGEGEVEGDTEDVSAAVASHHLRALAPQWADPANRRLIDLVPFSVQGYNNLTLGSIKPSAQDFRNHIERQIMDLMHNTGSAFLARCKLEFS
jgi:arginine-tRNA-protein transferase